MQVYAQKLEYPATNLLNMVAFEIFMVNVGGGKMLNDNDKNLPWDKIYPSNFKFCMEARENYILILFM